MFINIYLSGKPVKIYNFFEDKTSLLRMAEAKRFELNGRK